MSKNKLKKFDEMAEFSNVFQYPFDVLQSSGCPYKGKWKQEVFRNSNPIILELGCGRGEYAVGLARLHANMNYIGIDIKGARMWAGAKEAIGAKLKNVAFVRTNIELLPFLFERGEIAEIWLTFPDPQMKKVTKRMTSAWFLRMYGDIMEEGGSIHLKTDSNFMFTYTSEIVKLNNMRVKQSINDLYGASVNGEGFVTTDPSHTIRTKYEQQWLERGIAIKYMRFIAERRASFAEPTTEIPPDEYRSYNRSRRGEKGE